MNLFKSGLIAIAATSIFSTSIQARNSFAIVVDAVTYAKAANEIKAYAEAVDRDGLHTIIIKDTTGCPDSIKANLIRLHADPKMPLEGAVFIGDIPVPMVRDAQHLTSAFKMDQVAYPWHESSVPSDRFYDDFDLKFDYIRTDSVSPLYHYYSLRPDSPQYLAPDIYSGRIKAVDDGINDKYELIRRYLRKVVKQKETPNVIDQLLFFSGHGYVSESIMARIDEKGAHLQNFPWMHTRQQGIEYIDHKRDKSVKTRLMSELQRNNLDVALLHHHGDSEIEYLNNEPDPETPSEMVQLIKDYAGYSYRRHRGKGTPDDSLRIRIARNLGGVPLEWLADEESPEQHKRDSLNERKLNLYVEDFAKFTPNCRLVILDACFNGSFHKDKYIAGSYIFDDGLTVAAIANSVNVLQDKWSDRYLGLAGLGMRLGNLVRYNTFLESHFIGDPTFHFTSAIKGVDANQLLSRPAKAWKKELSSELPALRAMAMRQLSDANLISSAELLNIYTNDNSEVVRMEAMNLLSLYDDENFVKCLDLVVDDSYEMIQRYGLNFIAKRGDTNLIPAIIRLAKRNNTGKRVEFGISQTASLYPADLLVAELNKSFNPLDYAEGDIVRGHVEHALRKYADSYRMADVDDICHNDSATVKRKLQAIRTLRNSTMHYRVDELLSYLNSCDNDNVTVNLLEALGWFRNSFRHNDISEAALAISRDSNRSQQVRDMALRTYNRIVDNRR
ncbi:MAG: hypothetical protein NC343_03050 [Muribaculum sp.]|nr:hypothetical protein [Muribaculaceae bacterium]MCM1080705.1 hypothetical protein [Muribaculum sp.]